MTQQVLQLISACQWAPVKYLIVSPNVFDSLIYYSHLFPLGISLLLGFFVFVKGRKNLSVNMLFITTLLVSVWLFSDMVVWATNVPSLTMFFWTLTIMVEPIIYAGVLYFLYLFIEGKDISFAKKLIIILLLTPSIVLASTKFGLLGYDLSNCDRDAVQGPLVYYGFLIEAIFIIWIFVISIKNFIKEKDRQTRIKIFLATVGSLGFLVTFAFGNVIGSFFNTYSIGGDYSWTIGQYGIFGVPIFITFLAYLISKYNILNIKVLYTQILVSAVWIVIAATLFITSIDYMRVVTGITLIPLLLLAIELVRSVKKEVEAKEREHAQREIIEKQKNELEIANKKLEAFDVLKSKFLSLASHQLRSPITVIKSCVSLFLEGEYGEINELQRNMLNQLFQKAEDMNEDVEKYLTVARIDQGGLQYNLAKLDMSDLVGKMTEGQKIIAQKKGLDLSFETDGNSPYLVNGDKMQLKQVVQNLVDNAMKFTKEGWIKVKLSKDQAAKKIRLVVSDSGRGIKPEIIPTLFKEFSRGDGATVDVGGSGIGIYAAKEIVEKGHGGKIWVESEGDGRGSTFIVELPEILSK